MRGLSTTVAAVLSLVPAGTWASPEVIADGLVDDLPPSPQQGVAGPVLADETNYHQDASENVRVNGKDDSAGPPQDHVLQWLHSLPTSDLPDGSVLTSSLFNTLTVSSALSSVTPLAQNTFFTSAPVLTSTTAFHDTTAAAPIPTQRVKADIRFKSQKPFGALDRVWDTAKTKIQSISALLCPESHSPINRGGPSVAQVVLHNAGSYDTLDEDYYVLAASPVAATDSPSPVSPQPTARSSIPPPIAAVPAATAAASGVTHILVTHLSSPSHGLDGSDQSSPSPDHTTIKVVAAILSIILTVVLTCVIAFIIIRRNPRRQAERLAVLEECRNIRAYRKAASRHRFRRWGQATFGRFWLFKGSGLTTTQIVGSEAEKEAVAQNLLAYPQDTQVLISQEIESFRAARDQVTALLRAEEGRRIQSKQHPADRNRRRTYLWLFGGRRNRPRSGSTSDSDAASVHSDSEKSVLTGVTSPPVYDEREKYQQVDDRFLIKVVTGARDSSDRSSVSSLVPTSPKDGSLTLGSYDGEFSEKGDL